MCLIIEGSDALGKTTFAKKLEAYCAKYLPTYYGHMTKQNIDKFDFLYDYKPMIQSCIINDRLHLGTLAYPDYKMTKDMLEQIEQWIYEKAGSIVIFYASDEEWYRRILKKDTRINRSTETKERMFQANNIYKSFVEETKLYYNFQPKFDFSFNIKPIEISETSIPYYPSQKEVEIIAQKWINRRLQLRTNI